MVGCAGLPSGGPFLSSVVSTLYSPPPLINLIGGGFKTQYEGTIMNIANQLFNKAFHSTRDPRSEAYKAGVLDTLNFKESGSELKHPFEPRTAESDAWFAGNQEVLNLWRDHQANSGVSFPEKLAILLEESLAKRHGRKPRPVTAEALERMEEFVDNKIRTIPGGAN